MLIMLPAVMLLGKLDYTDDTILLLARVAYFSMAAINWLGHKLVQSKITAANDTTVIYVPQKQPSLMGPAPTTADTPRMKTTYMEHENKEAAQKTQQAMMGVLMMALMTFKFELHMPLLLQALMTAVELFTSPLLKRHVLGMKVERPYEELLEGEDGAVETVTPEGGAADGSAAAGAGGSTTAVAAGADKAVVAKMEAKINKLWDDDAVFPPDAFDAILAESKEAVNAQTSDNGWTALMVAVGIQGQPASTVHRLVNAGADRALTDKDNWTALHWAAYNGNVTGAMALLDACAPSEERMLLAMRDNDGNTATQIALDALKEEEDKEAKGQGDAPDLDDDAKAKAETARKLRANLRATVEKLQAKEKEAAEDAAIEAEADGDVDGAADGSASKGASADGVRQRKGKDAADEKAEENIGEVD